MCRIAIGFTGMTVPATGSFTVGGTPNNSNGAGHRRGSPPKRRRNGEGSVFWWERRRRWVVRVTLPEGKRAVYYCRTKTEAERTLRAAVAAAKAGHPLRARGLTLARYLTEVFLPRLKGKPSHVARTTEIVQVHLAASVLGRVHLTRLRPIQVEDWKNAKLAEISSRTGKPYSPTTVRLMHVTLRRALADAVRWEFVDRNVAALVATPSTSKFEGTAWSVEEAVRFLEVAADDPLEALWVLAVTTGMRQGELLGLRWADVRLVDRRLSVEQSMVWIHGHAVPGTPKTPRSRREVELVGMAVAALERQATRQAALRRHNRPRWNDLDLVFCNGVGNPLNPATLRTRRFIPLIGRAGVPRIRFHDMRGTTASLLYAAGADDRQVQDLLGHSSVTTTHDRYIHTKARAQPNAKQREAVDRLEHVLTGSSDGAGRRPPTASDVDAVPRELAGVR
jgi:integrase